MIVLVAGGSGFLGKRVVHFLEKQGHTAIVHHRGFQAVPTYADAIINCVGIIRGTEMDFKEAHVEKTKWLLKLGKKLQIQQFVQVSAIGVDGNGTAYQKTKLRGERLVVKSGLPYAIVRPGMLFGKGDISVNVFRRIAGTGFFPMFSGARLQPVSVDTVARLVVAAAEKRVRNRIAEIGGPEIFTYESFADRIHPGVISFRLPWLLVRLITLLGSIIPAFPTRDMVMMMRQDNVTRDKTVWRLGITNPSLK